MPISAKQGTGTEEAKMLPSQKERAASVSVTEENGSCSSRSGEVRVVIQYCKIGNYSRVAREQDQAIRAEFAGLPVEVKMASSSGGVYEVTVNEKLIFSKKATYRLPSDEEIFYHIRAALARLTVPVENGGQ